MDYRWDKESWQVAYKRGVDANAFGRVVEGLRKQHGNEISPVAIVDEARPDDSPIHPLFEWDDTEAAEAWRVHQARNALNSIRIVVLAGSDDEKEVYANISIQDDAGHRSYLPATAVAASPELMEKAVDEAMSYLRSWEARWRNLQELGPIFEAVREVEKQRRARRKPGKRMARQAVGTPKSS